jgi:hypothetical protein
MVTVYVGLKKREIKITLVIKLKRERRVLHGPAADDPSLETHEII